MVPELVELEGVEWRVLPAGIHIATFSEVKALFVYNARRAELFEGLLCGSVELANAACKQLYLDGSYVTSKEYPGDFDACWDSEGIDWAALDADLRDYATSREEQKSKYGGEFYPASAIADMQGHSFLELFQLDRFTNRAKGIVAIDLSNDSMIQMRR